MPEPAFRIVVLASGGGTNLQALIDQIHGKQATIAGVLSDKPGAGALDRAAAANIETATFPAFEFRDDRSARDEAMAEWIEAQEAGLVVLAGFMQILSQGFIRRFRNRIINVHPALLPAFPGIHSIERALEQGVKVTGVTVHFVDEGVDSGPVILQQPLEIKYPAVLAEVEQAIHAIEHKLLPEAVGLIAEGRVELSADNQRVVLIDD